MNDWPADPKLDESLRRFVRAELAAADSAVLSKGPLTPRSRDRGAFAGLVFLAVIAIVASLVLRTGPGRGGAAAGGPAGSGRGTTITSPTPEPTPTLGPTPTPKLTLSPTPSPTPTPNPKVNVAPISSQTPSPWFSPTGSMNITEDGPNSDAASRLADGRVLIVHGGDTAVELYDPATGKFSPTGSMTTTRFGQTLTLLQDGRVLVTGGYNCADAAHAAVLASAEVYDPATGVFTPTGSMSTPREYQTATRLRDGRVLVTGGITVKVQLASAELYDPRTGKFTPTGSMNIPRDGHTATLLNDGRVLISGSGDEGNAATASAEVYDPTTGKFSRTGSMIDARTRARATLLDDGRVLITGGSSDGTSAELYDAATGKFSLTGSLNVVRGDFTTTLLSDGRVLVAGGWGRAAGYAVGNAISSAELYDPTTGKFATAGSMGGARMDQTATLLGDGRVLIAGGCYLGDAGAIGLASAEIYQP